MFHGDPSWGSGKSNWKITHKFSSQITAAMAFQTHVLLLATETAVAGPELEHEDEKANFELMRGFANDAHARHRADE